MDNFDDSRDEKKRWNFGWGKEPESRLAYQEPTNGNETVIDIDPHSRLQKPSVSDELLNRRFQVSMDLSNSVERWIRCFEATLRNCIGRLDRTHERKRQNKQKFVRDLPLWDEGSILAASTHAGVTTRLKPKQARHHQLASLFCYPTYRVIF